MKILESGSYTTQGTSPTSYEIKWSKMDFLSEAYAEKISSLSSLGVLSFQEVESKFLLDYPNAVEEDPNLSCFKGLQGEALQQALKSRLTSLFVIDSSHMSDSFKTFMKDSFYFIITIQEQNTEQVLGFITLMGGKPLNENEYKITILAVDPEKRREGLASLLIDSLNKINLCAEKLLVSTRPSNQPAIKAYEKWGFVENKELSDQQRSHFTEGHWVHLVKSNS